MSDVQNPFATPQADLVRPEDKAPSGGERSLEAAMAGEWSITPSDLLRQGWDLKDGFKGLFIMAAIVMIVPGAVSSGLSRALAGS